MVQMHVFPTHAVPREIACQIRSYVRIQWPFLDGHSGRVWDIRPSDALTFVLMEDEMLVSHAQVKRRDFEFEGEMLKVYGISAVFTYPAWRGSGRGKEIVQAATDFIRKGEADIAMLFCSEPRKMLYMSCGWEPMPTTRILEGNKENPKVHENLLMLLSVTPRGRELQQRFENNSVYVGATTW